MGRYRCFLPDLAGFAAFPCAGPGYQRRAFFTEASPQLRCRCSHFSPTHRRGSVVAACTLPHTRIAGSIVADRTLPNKHVAGFVDATASCLIYVQSSLEPALNYHNRRVATDLARTFSTRR